MTVSVIVDGDKCDMCETGAYNWLLPSMGCSSCECDILGSNLTFSV